MKGEKGDKTNKAIELLYKLSLRDDFKYEIQVLRLKHGIPKNGFGDKENRRIWDEKKDIEYFYNLMLSTMERYDVPTSYLVPFQEYVESGILEAKTKQLDYVGFIDRYAHRKEMNQGNIEDWYIAKEQPFVKLILLGNTSKKDVHDFIDKNWETIKNLLGEQGDDPDRRVKKIQFKERDRQIIELAKKSNSELRAILGPENKVRNLKENLIRNIMQRKEYGNYKISEGYIKKIIDKYKK
jgi:hypothetical protein